LTETASPLKTIAKNDSQATEQLLRAARRLREDMRALRFGPPVTHVYNPLDYAWAGHEMYLRKYGGGLKRVVFLGMNPGPFGMVQTGVPFGEVAAVRDWLGIQCRIKAPPLENSRRPVLGFDCQRSEISGQRLWGLFAKRFGDAEKFFAEHIVMNYCPLAFVEASGCNRTPDKLSRAEREQLFVACDAHLRKVISVFQPEWLIGVGDFATKRARAAATNDSPRIGQILHPSPASPAANRDWEKVVTAQLKDLGVWR
jgi:single-strand selective monofunctional uracil DNA glycosylase